jgi:hypothetical protein
VRGIPRQLVSTTFSLSVDRHTIKIADERIRGSTQRNTQHLPHGNLVGVIDLVAVLIEDARPLGFVAIELLGERP